MPLALLTFLALSQAPALNAAVVALDACDPPALSKEVQLFRQALGSQPGLKTWGDSETLAPWGGPSRGTQADAEQALRKAQEEFVEDHVVEAMSDATRTLEIVRALPPSNDRWDFERETQVLMALIELKTKKTAEAEDRLRKLMRVDPTLRARAGITPEAFLQRLEAMRQEAETVSKSTLTINTVPSGLPVFVDGVGVGASPAHPRLPKGDYLVSARWGSSHRGLPVRVHVEQATSVLLSAGFEGSIYADSGPCVVTEGDAPSRVAQLADLGRALGVTTMVGLRESEDPNATGKQLVALVVDTTKAKAVREAAIARTAFTSAGNLGGLARFIANGTTDDPAVHVVEKAEEVAKVVEPPPPPPPKKTEPVAETKSAESPGLRIGSYVTAGLATAAVGVGIFTFIQGDNADSEIQQLVNPTKNTYYAGTESQYERLAAEENLNRTLAVSLWLGAAVCAVAAVTLYVTSGGWGGQPLVAGIGPGPSAGLTLHF